MVAVGVGEEDEFEVQFFLGEKGEHAAAIRAGVEGDGCTAGVPREVGVHGHVLEGRVELREAVERDGRGRVGAVAERGERVRFQTERRSDGAGGGLVPRAVAQFVHGFGGHAGGGGELGVADLESAHRLADDVAEGVFERDGHARVKN